MSDHVDRYHTVSAGFEARLDSCPPERWDTPSPCPGWTARDVVVHSAQVHRNVMGMLADVEAVEIGPDADAVTSWKEASAELKELLGDPSVTATPVSTRTGEMPFEQLVGTLLCSDTVVHTWDLARATGQDEHLDPAAVAATLSFLTPNDERLRVPGGFGPKIEPPGDADEQVRLLCFTGRRV